MTKTSSKIRSITAMIILIILVFCFQAAIAYGTPRVETSKNVYKHGERISVHYYNAPGNAKDWICIAPAGSSHATPGNYRYIPRRGDGVVTFKSPRPGKYETRAYYNYVSGRYLVSAVHSFTVR